MTISGSDFPVIWKSFVFPSYKNLNTNNPVNLSNVIKIRPTVTKGITPFDGPVWNILFYFSEKNIELWTYESEFDRDQDLKKVLRMFGVNLDEGI